MDTCSEHMLLIKQVFCRKCGSLNVFKKVQIFKNNTKHLYCKCQECRFQFYAPRKLITPQLNEEPSRQKKKLDKKKDEELKILKADPLFKEYLSITRPGYDPSN